MSEGPGYVNGTLSYRVGELEKDLRDLSRKVERLTWAIVGLSLTIAGAAISLVLTATAGGPG